MRDEIMRYIAFDVETPNRCNNRMSAIGISGVEDGEITEEFYSLVDPEQPFDWFNTQLTGISAESVEGAPTFPELWEKIEPLMSSGVLAAHNAGFDMGVLRKCLCDYYGIGLDHHRADSDSHACAEILLRYIRGGAEPEKFIRTYNMR